MIGAATTIYCKKNQNIQVKILPGHFAMTHSHTNYYVDVMEAKLNQAMARESAETLTADYLYQCKIDTILCMDGSEIIGAFMAEKLAQGNMFAATKNEDIYIVTPENENSRQMIIRDNIQPMIKGKNVLILCGSVITGKNVLRALRCIEYYGGKTVGVGAVFTTKETIEGLPISYLIHQEDIPDFKAYDYLDCEMCKAGERIDALANCYGYSKL